MYMLKSLTIKDGRRFDTYYAADFGDISFKTQDEAERFLIASDYEQDGETKIWNRINTGKSLDQIEITSNAKANHYYYDESIELLTFLESYQAEQKEKASLAGGIHFG